MLAEPGIEIQRAVNDPLSARIAEDAGFNLVGLATTEPLASLDDMAHDQRHGPL
jgi:hypothetical protein